MNKNTRKNIFAICVSISFLLACIGNRVIQVPGSPTFDVPAINTYAVQTVMAQITTSAVPSLSIIKLANTPTVQPFSLEDFNVTNVVDDLAINIDGKTIAVATNGFHIHDSGEYGVWLWNTTNLSSPVSSFGTSIHHPNSVTFSHDGQLLAISGCDPTDNSMYCIQRILVLDWRTGNTLHEFVSEGRAVSRIYFSFDDHLLSAQDVNGNISLWNLETEKQQYSFKSARGADDNNFAFSPDGSIVAVGDVGVELWDLKTYSLTKVYDDLTGGVFWAPIVAFSSDGQLLTIGGCAESDFETCVKYKIIVLDTDTGKGKAELIPDSRATAIEFSPDDRLLAIGSFTGLQIWDFQAQKDVYVSELSTVPILDLAFSPDGKLLVVGGATGLHIIKLSEIMGE